MTNETLLKDITINLSDFALFLSVVKNPTAYRNILSIIVDNPDLQLQEVKVEQVILNKSGKRAIRLDAWAVDTSEHQYNMEMENHSQHDSLPKRSRFYQSIIDTPILKSGSKTKYTFIEKCEEIEDLYLDDGTKKIFVNMSSKNGSQELVSLLQYMKDTRLDNPDILIKDPRIVELDQIVTEVKQSEEWEGIEMNILEIGIEKGREEGLEKGRTQGVKSVIEVCKSLGTTWDKALELVIDKFSLTEDSAREYMNLYW